jgi:hypothetical protein
LIVTARPNLLWHYGNSEIIRGWYVCILKLLFSINIICNFLLESNLF